MKRYVKIMLNKKFNQKFPKKIKFLISLHTLKKKKKKENIFFWLTRVLKSRFFPLRNNKKFGKIVWKNVQLLSLTLVSDKVKVTLVKCSKCKKCSSSSSLLSLIKYCYLNSCIAKSGLTLLGNNK